MECIKNKSESYSNSDSIEDSQSSGSIEIPQMNQQDMIESSLNASSECTEVDLISIVSNGHLEMDEDDNLDSND